MSALEDSPGVVKVFVVIGAFVVIEDLLHNLIVPVFKPVVAPTFDAVRAPGLVGLALIIIDLGALAFSKAIKRYLGM